MGVSDDFGLAHTGGAAIEIQGHIAKGLDARPLVGAFHAVYAARAALTRAITSLSSKGLVMYSSAPPIPSP